MSVTIRFFDGIEATIDGYRWTCADKQLEASLNDCLDPGGPSSADAAPDIHAAEAMALLLKGEIVYADPPDPVIPGRIYGTAE